MDSKTKETKKENKMHPFKLKPMPRIENKEKIKFSKLTDVLMSYNLIPYFTIKEAKEFGKINTRFYNSFIRYYERIADDLIEKYNIKNEENYNPNEIYEQKDDRGHFIKVNFSNLTHYLIFSYFDWTWKNDDRYWETITPKNSILNKNISHLKTVCWVDVNATMTHLFQGKYKLYLNHCVCNLSRNTMNMKVLLDGLSLLEILYPSNEQINNCRNAHEDKEEEDKKEENKKEEDKKKEDKKEEDKKEEHAISDNLNGPVGMIGGGLRLGLRRIPYRGIGIRRPVRKGYNKDKSLHKEYIMDIDVNYDKNLDNGVGHELIIRFDHANGNWKNDWLIDGIILEKIEENIE